jgi:hypothetical protein
VPPAAQPTCKAIDTLTTVFAADGYFPAPPNGIYVKVVAAVSAGSEPLRFRNHGDDAVLTIDGRSHPSLGSPADGMRGLPVLSRKGTVDVPAGGSRETALLFLVPRESSSGELSIRGAGRAALTLPGKPLDLPANRLLGAYREAAPRNLRPLLRDPVMAAVQSAPKHRLVIAEARTGLRVAIPAAAVSGSARRVAPGLFRAPLRRGGHVLDCTLRFLGGGQSLLLYLADRPFHQLTYERTSAAALARPATSRPGGADRPGKRRPKGPRRPRRPKRPTGPGLGPDRVGEAPGYDPNARPNPKREKPLPTGPSIFDN